MNAESNFGAAYTYASMRGLPASGTKWAATKPAKMMRILWPALQNQQSYYGPCGRGAGCPQLPHLHL